LQKEHLVVEAADIVTVKIGDSEPIDLGMRSIEKAIGKI
jgi:hypothetical protein